MATVLRDVVVRGGSALARRAAVPAVTLARSLATQASEVTHLMHREALEVQHKAAEEASRHLDRVQIDAPKPEGQGRFSGVGPTGTKRVYDEVRQDFQPWLRDRFGRHYDDALEPRDVSKDDEAAIEAMLLDPDSGAVLPEVLRVDGQGLTGEEVLLHLESTMHRGAVAEEAIAGLTDAISGEFGLPGDHKVALIHGAGTGGMSALMGAASGAKQIIPVAAGSFGEGWVRHAEDMAAKDREQRHRGKEATLRGIASMVPAFMPVIAALSPYLDTAVERSALQVRPQRAPLGQYPDLTPLLEDHSIDGKTVVVIVGNETSGGTKIPVRSQAALYELSRRPEGERPLIIADMISCGAVAKSLDLDFVDAAVFAPQKALATGANFGVVMVNSAFERFVTENPSIFPIPNHMQLTKKRADGSLEINDGLFRTRGVEGTGTAILNSMDISQIAKALWVVEQRQAVARDKGYGGVLDMLHDYTMENNRIWSDWVDGQKASARRNGHEPVFDFFVDNAKDPGIRSDTVMMVALKPGNHPAVAAMKSAGALPQGFDVNVRKRVENILGAGGYTDPETGEKFGGLKAIFHMSPFPGSGADHCLRFGLFPGQDPAAERLKGELVRQATDLAIALEVKDIKRSLDQQLAEERQVTARAERA